MIKLIRVSALLSLALLLSSELFAYTTEHHLVNMGRNLLNVVASPFKGAFIQGPKDVKKMYSYEVHQREKPENRALLRFKLWAIWSAPAVELKAIITGLVESVEFGGKFCKELLSIPFSD